MIFVLGSESPVAIVSYVIAAYTLTIWCFKIPYLIKFFKRFKQENKYIKRWQSDARLRIKISLYGALVMGSGMSLVMTDLYQKLDMSHGIGMLVGVILGVVGIALVGLAYPIYNRIIVKERQKIAPQIICLTDELMQ